MDPQQTPEHQLQPEQKPVPQGQIHNPLAVMQPGEQIICEIKRHPIGMLGVYIAAGFIIIVLAILAFVVAPNAADSAGNSSVTIAAGLGFVVLTVLVLVFVLIANIVYWGNHWVVTSDSITQITQTSLFSKQSAQLSLGNLEDITSEQNGILAQLFHFGTLKAETAGERSKFMFPFCPRPNYYAQKILAAREVFEQAHHGGKQEPFQQPQPPAAPQPAPYQAPVSQPPAGPGAQAQPEPTLQPSVPAPPDDGTPQYQIGQTPPDFGPPPDNPA